MKKINLAIVGATGMVGKTFLKVLEDRDFPVGELVLLASEKSAGKRMEFRGKVYEVEELTPESMDPERFQAALFSVSAELSLIYGKIAAERGIVVVDNSSAWRMAENIPLVVPEVNLQAAFGQGNLIANPNCSTIQSVIPLAVIDRLFKAKRVIYTTYQAVSGSGYEGVEDLLRTQRGEEGTFYPKPIADNCLPHIDVFQENGYTKEEQKMIDETRKILGRPDLAVTATCVRVPVKNGHSVAMNVSCERPIDLELLKRELKNSEGIILYETGYPTARDADGQDNVLVGRLRVDESERNTLHLWSVADNIRKGAATNAVQILEKLMEEKK